MSECVRVCVHHTYISEHWIGINCASKQLLQKTLNNVFDVLNMHCPSSFSSSWFVIALNTSVIIALLLSRQVMTVLVILHLQAQDFGD